MIKVENPTDGDLARKLGNVPKLNKELMGTSFLAQNANKKSLTLNLKKPEAKEIFKKLVATADVVVENFRPGVMKRLGVGWETLREINPRLVYCAISGFGQDGPDADKPAYDQIIQGLRGEMDVNGDERLNPLRAGFPVCDTVGGLNAAFAILAALYHRERTGEGQVIDVALLDSIMPLMGWVAANLLIGGQPPVAIGNDNFTAAPSGMFRTKDGFVNIAANKQEQWEAVCDVLGVPELKTDPRFQERDTRKKNRQALTPLLEAKLARAADERVGRPPQREGRPVGRHPHARGGAEAAAGRPPEDARRRSRLAGIGDAPPLQPDGEVREDPRVDRRAARRASARTPQRSSAGSATPRSDVARLKAEGRRCKETHHGNDRRREDPGARRGPARGQRRGRRRAARRPGDVATRTPRW